MTCKREWKKFFPNKYKLFTKGGWWIKIGRGEKNFQVQKINSLKKSFLFTSIYHVVFLI